MAGTTAVAAALTLPRSAKAQDSVPWKHALSLFDSVKYPADFKRFDYVNPNAPKGGTVRLAATGTFDNFNFVIASVKGSIAGSILQTSDTLLTGSQDEVSTEYGLLAEAVAHPPDFSWAKFRLRAEAKWHDGKPVTVEDVIFSFDATKKLDPQLGAYYRHVTKAEKTGEREITFTFDQAGNRELPLILGQLNVIAKHWWEGKDAQGRQRDISQTTLEPPLGCGAYRIKSFEAGRSITYERVKDYWGKDLAVNVGRENFDELRYDYFRDSTVALEAFKGDQIDYRSENSAKDWATAYDFPATREGRVVREEFVIRNSGMMQAFAFNTRRDKFQDIRVRRALGLAFDFDEINKTMFYGQYIRIDSYFKGTELAWNDATDGRKWELPTGKELEILETVRDKVPAEVFTEPYRSPQTGSAEATRNNLREATRLLKDAGYEIRDRKLVNVKTNEPFTIEILLNSPTFERVALFMKPSLDRLGVTMSVRSIDDSQYENRMRSWDFDIIVANWPESLSPGNEQLYFWGSKAADQAGSRNYVGIKNPAVDALIEKIIFAKNREELVAATRAMDRVLMWNFYVIPQWTYGKARTARWDRFAHPEKMPEYGASAFPNIWWWDAAKAAKTGGRS
nr:extracellular solute-binding protein [Variibacter gotjawalensis]